VISAGNPASISRLPDRVSKSLSDIALPLQNPTGAPAMRERSVSTHRFD
jgi:hypothetical protein